MKNRIAAGPKIEREVTVQRNYQGYAWPAAAFVGLVSRYNSDVRVWLDGKEVDGKSVLDLAELTPPQGAKVCIDVQGPDAAKAVRKIDELIESFQRES